MPRARWARTGLAHHAGPVALRLLAPDQIGEYVLDEDHADHFIERVAIDRHARMAMFGKGGQHIGPWRIMGQRNDLSARDADIGRVQFGKMQQVAQHLTFQHRKVARFAGAAFSSCSSMMSSRWARSDWSIAPVKEAQNLTP
jgi:hypothetical protein